MEHSYCSFDSCRGSHDQKSITFTSLFVNRCMLCFVTSNVINL